MNPVPSFPEPTSTSNAGAPDVARFIGPANATAAWQERTSVVLAPNVVATLRPVTPADAEAECAFVAGLSTDSRYNRFHGAVNGLSDAMARYLTRVDQLRHVALVVTIDNAGAEMIIADARYVVEDDGGSAEFAIAIADHWQGRGLAKRLMEALASCARRSGLRWLVGEVLARNARMLSFADRLGFARSARGAVDGVVRIERAVNVTVPPIPESRLGGWTRGVRRWFASRPAAAPEPYGA